MFIQYYFLFKNSIEEALIMISTPTPDFSVQRQQLIDSFPYDLWEI